MFHLFNTDLGGVRGTFGFFNGNAGAPGDLQARRGEYNDGLNQYRGTVPLRACTARGMNATGAPSPGAPSPRRRTPGP